MKTRSKITFALIVVTMIVYALSSQLLPSDKARITKAIERARVGCEKEDIAAVMSLFSRDYSDEYGLTKAAWLGLIQRHFQIYDDIRVRIVELKVIVADGADTGEAIVSARARASIARTMGNADKLAEQRLGAVDVARLHFRKEGKDWKLIRAEHLNPEQW